MVQQLNGISEIRTFFRTNTQPIYFVGPTAFNLLGIDRWVRNFQYVVYYDSWDGAHPRVFAPSNQPYVEFESSEQISNYLLRDPEVQAHLKKRGGTPMIVMVFFDEETEEICEELGYNLIMPSDSLRRRLDSKIVTTQLGNEAGAPSVPNVLGTADSWEELQEPVGGQRSRLRPGRADAVRRLRQDHVLHQGGGRLGQERRRHHRRAAQGDEADRQQGGGGRGLHHQARHDRRPVHDRPDRLPRAHAVQGRAGAATTCSPRRCPRSSGLSRSAMSAGSATVSPRRATRASSRSTSSWTSRPTRSTSAS